MVSKKNRGKLIIKVKEEENKLGEKFYHLVADATDGITSCVFFPYNGWSLIRIATENGVYSLKEGLCLTVDEFPKIVKNENIDGEPLLPTSEGFFPLYVDIEDIIIFIYRERKKIRQILAEKGEEKIYEI